jgi:hypothetical protein
MNASESRNLRDHVLWLLDSQSAHASFDAALAGFPAKLRGAKAEGVPHTAWQLLEHLRLGQHDILEYCSKPKHTSPKWPAGFWPPHEDPPTKTAWEKSVRAFRADLRAMKRLVRLHATTLLDPMPHTSGGVSLLTEALLLVDHNAYHIGQLVLLRRALGAWE